MVQDQRITPPHDRVTLSNALRLKFLAPLRARSVYSCAQRVSWRCALLPIVVQVHSYREIEWKDL